MAGLAASTTPIELVLSRLPSATKNGKGWTALCPAHADSDPSLSLTEGDDGRVLLHCFAGCDGAAVVKAMGLSFADLFVSGRVLHPDRRPKKKRNEPKAATKAEANAQSTGARIVCMADVRATTIGWLWRDRIPLGKITMLIGDPGLGKTWLALWLMAQVTRGGALPDGGTAPTSDVVFLTAEDGLADTIRPRLDAAGADASHVWALQAIAKDDAGERSFCLADDVDRLETVVNEMEAGWSSSTRWTHTYRASTHTATQRCAARWHPWPRCSSAAERPGCSSPT